ncbi:prolyl oligopeptidase family serine peptidase [Pedobacter sp. P351]|uniref:S9 family peptidase n=1 Tax=Pedobacter superstes TaxID=3133441 RepID=UPI0030AA4C31
MQKQLKLLSVIGLFLLAACSYERTAKKIPIEDFFRNPVKTSFKISPDGRYISYQQPYKNRMNIFVQSIDGKNVTRITDETQYNTTFYCWANNNELLFMNDNGKEKSSHLYAVNRAGKNFRGLLPVDSVRVRLINSDNIINDQLLIALNKRDSTIFDAYRLNIREGKLTLAEKNPGNIIQWFADEYGMLRMALASDGVNETLLFRNSEKESFRPVITNNFKNKITPVGFCKKIKSRIYALSNLNRDKTALVEFDCITGKETKIIVSHPDVDISEAAYSTSSHKLLFAGFETWKKDRIYLNDSVKAVYKHLENLLPNNEIRVADRDLNEQQFVIRTFTDKTPGAFYHYSVRNKKLVKLSDINPTIPEDQMCSMKPVSFRSRDGLIINGYLTLPLGYKAKKLPLIVIPHGGGGPWSRNSWGFSSEVQFLANRGYAVFQVNFRGSKGYGKKFWIAGFKKWGTDIQNDITDGVNWLIAEGIADKKKIGIYGFGFGGYSALHALSFQPDLYACGASQSGFLNLFAYIKAVPPHYKPTLQMYYEMVGNPEKEMDELRAVSPVFHANKIKAPLLIAQDIKDSRVNVNETNQFVKELKKRKVPITYITKEGRDYNFRNAEMRVEFFNELEKFFSANLKK